MRNVFIIFFSIGFIGCSYFGSTPTITPKTDVDPIVQAATLVSADKTSITTTTQQIASLTTQLNDANTLLINQNKALQSDVAALNQLINPTPVIVPPIVPPTPINNIRLIAYTDVSFCIPCRQMEGIFKEIGCEEIAKPDANQKIRLLPTVVAYINNIEVARIEGITTKEKILNLGK